MGQSLGTGDLEHLMHCKTIRCILMLNCGCKHQCLVEKVERRGGGKTQVAL
jgi:hypothetical protein